MLTFHAQFASTPVAIAVAQVPRLLPEAPLTESTHVLAQRFARPAARAKLVAALAALRAAHPGAHLVLPPVLPDDDEPSSTAAVGATELLAVGPSAPGARLSRALVAGAARLGVEIWTGRVVGAARDGKLVAVDATVDGQKRALAARAFVVATGRFLAGGLEKRPFARDTVFGLPVVADGQAVGDRFSGDLVGDLPEKEHALFRAGVATDDRLRPLVADGTLFAENLFAAGSILDGYDPARDKTGLGLAALTGMLAGERAADAALA
jgi:glycerol-3-phosphate dehydrogenase subunit B